MEIFKIDEIKNILEQAGEILMSYFNKAKVLAPKEHRDILLEADMESEKFIIQKLQSLHPKIPFISEETYTNATSNMSGYNFVLDPLDGTINFSRGIPEFGISLGIQEKGNSIIGLVYKPVEKTFYEAVKGKGAFYNEKKIQTSKTKNLEEAIIAIDPSREEGKIPDYFHTLYKRIRAYRSYGCAEQTLGYIAQGKIDAYIFNKPKIWDFAAMNIIIQEAGGVITTHKGNEWHSGPILVSNKYLADKLISYL